MTEKLKVCNIMLKKSSRKQSKKTKRQYGKDKKIKGQMQMVQHPINENHRKKWHKENGDEEIIKELVIKCPITEGHGL